MTFQSAAVLPDTMTPAGLQKLTVLSRRRLIVAGLNFATYAGLLAWLAALLGDQGWSAVDAAIFACLAIALPWSVLGFWNALLGLWLLHGARDGLAQVAPFIGAGLTQAPLLHRTAILMTLRNEDPSRAFARLEATMRSLDQENASGGFGYFVLSDTDDARVAALEEDGVRALRARAPYVEIHYRRRMTNEGYKAGNLRDFCARWGGDYEFMLPLDADSVMSGETILTLVRIAQAHPRLGVLQSLVVGAPARSGFARVFQFGMRHGMRPYTMGSAWWTGDCGPFWGHNALVRIAPFRDHCHLPILPGRPPLGGPILSHDQVEAALMRRAGYECRVLPIECGSYEDNPPTLLDFTRRDLRWCQGNMQYFPLLRLRGLAPMSRFQLAWAILMFLGIPAMTAALVLIALKPFDGEATSLFPAASALGFYAAFLGLYLAPKLAGFLDVALTRGGLARYGGGARFAAGAALEVAFSFLLGAATTLRTSLFMIGLLFGRSVIWNGQARDARRLPLSLAAQGLWPPLAFGILLYGLALAGAPALILWSAPLTLGLFLAIPFAVGTSDPAFGRFLAQRGLCAIPEDLAPPPVLDDLASLSHSEQAVEPV